MNGAVSCSTYWQNLKKCKFQENFSILFKNCNIAVNLVSPSLKLYFEYSGNLRDFCFYKIILVVSSQLLLNFSEGFHY